MNGNLGTDKSKPTIVVSGSLVHDLIKVVEQMFKDCILPECIHMLNVSFSVIHQDSSWGGTGGNISYNLRLLLPQDHEVCLIAAVGKDGTGYIDRLRETGVNITNVHVDPNMDSATCDLITDRGNNQINTYYPGPAASTGQIDGIGGDIRLAIISPSSRDVMVRHLIECANLGIEVFFDPGQQITSFGREDLILAFKSSSFVFGNDNEIRSMLSRSGWNKDCLIGSGKTIITTFGGDGCLIECEALGTAEIPACRDIEVEDPTGAGDAFRAGFMTGYVMGCDLEVCARIGSVMASFAIEVMGTQNHRLDMRSFIERYVSNYGEFPRALLRNWNGCV